MNLSNLKEILAQDVDKIINQDFDVIINDATNVPSIDDSNITFPNIDKGEIKAKRIKTCVLYIDIRKSTELNLKHKPKTLTKLYSSFIRTMIKAAQHYNGKVRNIVGDRIMVVFDEDDCFTNAVNTAILLNSVSKHIINKAFQNNEVKCGIGIDYGTMLVSKGGIIKNGKENAPYKSLVWLGKPANIASKLTDNANKNVENRERLNVGYFHIIDKRNGYDTYYLSFEKFFSNNYISKYNMIQQPDLFGELTWFHSSRISAFPSIKSVNATSHVKTSEILMTEQVYNNYKEKNPEAAGVTNEWWTKVNLDSIDEEVYGGNVIFTIFQN